MMELPKKSPVRSYKTAFKKNDADQNFRLSTGLSYTFTHHREFRGNPGF